MIHRRQLMTGAALAAGMMSTSRSAWAQTGELQMADLMKLLASGKSRKSSFVERKFLRVLDTPVESSGELRFQAPQRLVKLTALPRPETLIIDGKQVSIERGSVKRTMSLDEFPDMASLVQSLTATFRGDQASLEQYFQWKLTGKLNQWQLTLRPKKSALFVNLREVKLLGDQDYVHSVETMLTDGDYSLLTLGRPVAMN
jgi:outer membrane lipoprotein-sorting protein